MRTVRKSPYLVAAFAVLLVACGLGFSEFASSGQSEEQPLTEQVAMTSAPFSKLDVGEECTQYAGNEGCRSGLCLRVSPGFPPKGFCSIPCDPADSDSCPDGPTPWQCLQAYPGWWVCAPAQTHASAVATLRGNTMPLPAKTTAVLRATPDAGLKGP